MGLPPCFLRTGPESEAEHLKHDGTVSKAGMNTMGKTLVTALALLSMCASAYGYEEIAVTEGGTLAGAVKLEGAVPKPKGYNLSSIWKGSTRANPSMTGGARQIEARDCLFLPFTTVVRDDQTVTVVNMDPVMHDIQAYETSHLGARVLFNLPLPMNPQHPRNFKERSNAALYHKHMAGAPMKQLVNLSKGRRIFVMQCGFHAYMESWGVAVSNPYFAKTDEQGRFMISDVPPGTYKLVVWHPYIRTAIERTVTVGPAETVKADVVVQAPTGRLYANEVMDHPYVRYTVPESTQREIDPMIKRQDH